jgi:hypothetical protein
MMSIDELHPAYVSVFLGRYQKSFQMPLQKYQMLQMLFQRIGHVEEEAEGLKI